MPMVQAVKRWWGGVWFEPHLSFTSVDDDSFKLWPGDQTMASWKIVYCQTLGEYDVDYLFWDGTRWGGTPREFATADLDTQVQGAWAARPKLGPGVGAGDGGR